MMKAGSDAYEACMASLNRLAKWRTVFAGWQLGTRVKGDPEGDAVRDHRELTMLLRAEVSALSVMLIEKGVFTNDEWLTTLAKEGERLSKDYERKFPGFKAEDYGIVMTPHIAADTMRGWKP